MSRATVRSAVVDWFDGHVTGLNKVRSSKPRDWAAADFAVTAPAKYGAAGYVYIESVFEDRIAGPAPTGKKLLEYSVALIVLFKSQLSDSEAAMDDYDALIERIKARLRADPRLGQADTVIFQAGQKFVEDLSDEPKYEGATQSVWGAVRFDVSEWVTA